MQLLSVHPRMNMSFLFEHVGSFLSLFPSSLPLFLVFSSLCSLPRQVLPSLLNGYGLELHHPPNLFPKKPSSRSTEPPHQRWLKSSSLSLRFLELMTETSVQSCPPWNDPPSSDPSTQPLRCQVSAPPCATTPVSSVRVRSVFLIWARVLPRAI